MSKSGRDVFIQTTLGVNRPVRRTRLMRHFQYRNTCVVYSVIKHIYIMQITVWPIFIFYFLFKGFFLCLTLSSLYVYKMFSVCVCALPCMCVCQGSAVKGKLVEGTQLQFTTDPLNASSVSHLLCVCVYVHAHQCMCACLYVPVYVVRLWTVFYV